MGFWYRKPFLVLVAILLIFNVMAVPAVFALNYMGYVPLPLPAGWGGGELSGVWGSSANDVHAVGTIYGLDGNTMPVFYQTNGTAWVSFEPLLPAGLVEGELNDIWGFSTGNVYAVGHGYDSNYAGLPLLYHNNGTGWTGAILSLPAELVEGYLLDIFGFSASNLYAIGYGYNADYDTRPLLYHNDGGGWMGTTLSLPAGWAGGSLSSVWSSSVTDLYLAGSVYDANRDTMPVLYHNDGTGWSGTVLSLPAGLVGGTVNSIWGVGADNIYMVGAGYNLNGDPQPLLYQNDGSGWTVSSLSLPNGVVAGYLNSVWGSAANDLYAAGNVYDAEGNYRPLFYYNDGTGWTAINLDLPAQFNEIALEEVWGFSASAAYLAGAGYPGIEGRGMPVLYQQMIFADVEPDYWARNFIERLYMAGITGGCATNPLRYCPEDTVTRAQMAVFLLRGIHTSSYVPPAVGSSTGFADVPVDYWSGPWIKQLAAEGITSGCGGGYFCPDQPVTRAQMAVFLLRSKYGAGYTPLEMGAGTGFGDVPADYWAAAWIKQLVTEGITSGCGSGDYCPENPVTRAQMAVFLVRTFSLP